ncbi:hypothetical protein [Polynucleobacter arcticus]|uniref:Transmembrane protein n=1 Tax=Polynucleobacter arcticus TaxID=1743165 RepID=A0A6M9PQR0_9BURK|nr:hypothetical protein [Polynucleobacter arcticus]QKM60176.1 hypothetical protein DN92_03470 [Polynucleobacter arcticus]
MKTVLHAMFGTIALTLVFASLLASLVSELWYSQEIISEVKALTLQGMLLLVLTLSLTAIYGLVLSKKRQGNIIQAKKKRMIWILLIATLVLLPISYLLSLHAQTERLDWLYFVPQGIEYIFDVIILILLGLNFIDGVKLVRQSAVGIDDKQTLKG